MPDILSVGIDIGTSTTQLVFSRITMENTTGYFSVPRVSITGKQVIYKSEVYLTPLLTPVLIDGHYYVDGGVVEELPVDVLRAQGADVVITSDLGIKRNFFDSEHPSPVDILRRSTDIMQAKLTRQQADKGDVVIRPDASFMGLLKINGYEESVSAGRLKAMEALPRIRELLGMDLPASAQEKDLPAGGQK